MLAKKPNNIIAFINHYHQLYSLLVILFIHVMLTAITYKVIAIHVLWNLIRLWFKQDIESISQQINLTLRKSNLWWKELPKLNKIRPQPRHLMKEDISINYDKSNKMCDEICHCRFAHHKLNLLCSLITGGWNFLRCLGFEYYSHGTLTCGVLGYCIAELIGYKFIIMVLPCRLDLYWAHLGTSLRSPTHLSLIVG